MFHALKPEIEETSHTFLGVWSRRLAPGKGTSVYSPILLLLMESHGWDPPKTIQMARIQL